MKKELVVLIIFTVIFIVSIFLFLNLNETDDSPIKNIKTFEVNDENDIRVTFTVENTDVGYGNENGTWVLLQLSPSYNFGVKFDGINIDQGVKVKDAYIELYSVGTPMNLYPNCKIYCDDTDNAQDFSSIGVLDICGRNYTDNYTRWNTTVEYLKWAKTPSLVNIIQEIVDRSNWTSGNSIAFLFISEGLRGYSASFQNFENGYPPKLYVEWE